MSETLTNTKLRLEQFISESFPSIDISPGSVISELLVKVAATLHNPIKNDIDALKQTDSVVNALASPEETYSDVITNIASNYNVARNEGNKATGNLKLIINSGDTFYVQKGAQFYQPVLKLSFQTTGTYKVTTKPTLVGDVQLKRINQSSLYYCIIPVEAMDIGSSYRLQDQTSLGLGNGTQIDNFVDAKVYGNFTGGLNKETDKELISRFKTGLTHKTLLSKDSIFYHLKELYPSLRDISLVTANDQEMVRSKQNVFGISTLGMVDVYTKSTFGLATAKLSVIGTKTATTAWSISLGKDDSPGFYKIISILPQGTDLTGSLEFTASYDYDTAGYEITNLLNNKYEARFTKYQTAEVDVLFDETSIDDRSEEVAVGTQEFFDVLVSLQPNIKEIQDSLLSADSRIACADYLVKAALPCFVTVNLKLTRNDPTVDFPVDLLKQDIYNYINSLDFGEPLHASAIINLCHKYDIKNVQLPLRLTGDIFSDHSTVVKITSSDVLEIPTKLSVGISPKTTVFISNYFAQSADPGVNITDAIGIEVV